MAAAQQTPEKQWRAFFVSVAVVLAVACGLNRMWSPISASSVWATLYRAAGEDPFTMHVTCKAMQKLTHSLSVNCYIYICKHLDGGWEGHGYLCMYVCLYVCMFTGEGTVYRLNTSGNLLTLTTLQFMKHVIFNDEN